MARDRVAGSSSEERSTQRRRRQRPWPRTDAGTTSRIPSIGRAVLAIHGPDRAEAAFSWVYNRQVCTCPARLRDGLYGYVDLGRMPHQLGFNEGVTEPRQRISIIHETCHVWQAEYGVEMAHLTLHHLAIGLDQDIIPTLRKFMSGRGAEGSGRLSVDLSRSPYRIRLGNTPRTPEGATSLAEVLISVWAHTHKVPMAARALRGLAVGVVRDVIPLLDELYKGGLLNVR